MEHFNKIEKLASLFICKWAINHLFLIVLSLIKILAITLYLL